MRIIYNGVDLMPLETHAFDCEPVYDDSGTDYLFTRVTILVRAIVNGQVAVVDQQRLPGGIEAPPGPPVSYLLGSSSVSLSNTTPPPRPAAMTPVNPISLSGSSPGSPAPPGLSGIDRQKPARLRTIVRAPNAPLLTHEAIRHRLSTPRGKLWVFAGAGTESGTVDKPSEQAIVSLECPEPEMICDCKNGPQPKVLSIPMMMGDATTMFVDWSCEAYINEGPVNDVNPSGALLSNRFAQKQMVDQFGFTTVITAGVAIFRTDLVYNFLESPDAKRSLLFMPIPQGFVRGNIQVDGVPAVNGISYSYQDRQVPVNFVAGPFVRAASISALHRQAIVTGDVIDGALNAYSTYLNLKANKHFADQKHPEKPAAPGSVAPERHGL